MSHPITLRADHMDRHRKATRRFRFQWCTLWPILYEHPFLINLTCPVIPEFVSNLEFCYSSNSIFHFHLKWKHILQILNISLHEENMFLVLWNVLWLIQNGYFMSLLWKPAVISQSSYCVGLSLTHMDVLERQNKFWLHRLLNRGQIDPHWFLAAIYQKSTLLKIAKSQVTKT